MGIFIFIGLVGITMLFFGIKWSLRSFKAKEIIQFKLINRIKEFVLKDTGLYSVCIIGGGYVNDSGGVNIRLTNIESLKEIDLNVNFIKPRFRKSWKIGVEYLQFRINETGNYKIEFENPEKLTVKKSMLKTKQIFQSNVPIGNLDVLIKETVPIGKRVLGILFLVFGVNMVAWGVMLLVNPNLIG